MKHYLISLSLLVSAYTHVHSQESGGKVGYANMDYIVSQMPELKDIQGQLTEAQTNLKNQLQAKTESFQKQYADYNANAGNMADTAIATAERRLQESQNSIREFQTQAQQTLQNYQKLLMAPLYLAAGAAIKKVALENGYAIIISSKISSMDMLLYTNSKTDISDLVIKKLISEQKKETENPKPVNDTGKAKKN